MIHTLSRHNQAGHAVWNACACCKESNAHDDIRDSKGVSNNCHLQKSRGKYQLTEEQPWKMRLYLSVFNLHTVLLYPIEKPGIRFYFKTIFCVFFFPDYVIRVYCFKKFRK